MTAHHTKDQSCNCGLMCLLALQQVREQQDAITKRLGGRYEGQSIVDPREPSPTNQSADKGVL